MYILIGGTKLNIIAETNDPDMLTLYIHNEYEMQDVYELFKNNKLDVIEIYHDDGSIYSSLSGYTTIDSFFFKPHEEQYVINLTKYKIDDLKGELENCTEKLNDLSQEIGKIQNGDFTKQSEYALQALVSTFTDEQALNCVLLFPKWDGEGVSYKKDDRLQYNTKLYKVLQDHTSQADWLPDSSPSLYVEVSDPAIEYPEWKQPTGAHDAYSKGDKVTYNGKKYISLIDANTYSPESYPAGWKLVE